MINRKKAIIMARVSSDEQAKGYSLDIQEENIRKWCHDRNIEVVECFREDHSAKNFNRPEWKLLKKYAKAHHKSIDYLLVTTWDRFSRNTTDAFNELFAFKQIGIEVQSIQQPIDFSIPESKVLLAIYLTLPEVDNDRRSMKIKEGIRAAWKSGRWSRNAPIGYKNSRDEKNKPIIIPGERAELMKFAFEGIARGWTQQYVIRRLKERGLIISRNNLSLLLRSPIYIGKIRIPADENEPEQIINALHEPIIDYDLFYEVQEILNSGYKSRNRKSQNTDKEELPLRGILYCSGCGNKITGSASRSKTGARHFYYHCNYCRKERYRASLVNSSIEDFLSELQFDKSVIEIYTDILKKIRNKNSNEKDKISVDVDQLKAQAEILKTRIDKIQDLLIDGILTTQDYTKRKNQYQEELDGLLSIIEPKEVINKEINNKIETGINLLVDAKSIYLKANVIDKQRLLSSMFPEKIDFFKGRCRTPRVNQLLLLIVLINKDLSEIKKGQLFQNLELSRPVESPGIEPGSKQGSKELSTRLVSAWVFDVVQGRKLPHDT